MIQFDTAALTGWAMALLWPFIRLLAFTATAPVFGHNAVPRPAKLAVALVLTILIAPTLPPMPDVPPVSYAGVWLVLQQIVIGVAMGLVMRVVFAVVQAAGDYIGLQMGLGFASFYSPAAGANIMVISRFLNLLAILFFLAINGHLLMIRILAESFITLPVGASGLGAAGWRLVALWGGTVFSAGLLLALPLVAVLLMISLALGIMNRASPQLSIFSVGFPLSLTTGLIMLTYMTSELGGIFTRLFQHGFETLSQLIGAMAG